MEELLEKANEIKNQEKPKGNTAFLVGTLFEKVIEAMTGPQLERRITCMFERTEFSYLNPEDMLVYRCLLSNVSTLEVSLDNRSTWQEVALTADGAVNLNLAANKIIWFRVDKSTIGSRAYATFFGRAEFKL